MLDDHFRWGFEKAGQEENMEQVAGPEGEEKDTAVTCVSDCQYSQNPEKRCMLDSVTFSQSEDGSFVCGQYAPLEEQPELGAQQAMPPQAPPQETKPTARRT